MIVIVDYKMGNLGSIQNILRKIGVPSVITSDKSVIADAKKIILPGVGGFAAGMVNLREMDLIDVLDQKALKDKVPVLGICLGMQLLGETSEEGLDEKGLAWIPAKSYKFQFTGEKKLPVPHIGWNYIKTTSSHPLTQNSDDHTRFYFVHSYYVQCKEAENVLAKTEYGQEFHSIIGKDNILGVQFHPEKSHRFGMNLLKNFAAI